MGVKTCKKCEIEKDVDEFYAKAKSGRFAKDKMSYCKPCDNKKDRRADKKAYKKHMYATDLAYRVLTLSRNRLNKALKGRGSKPARTMELVGCTADELISYLQELSPENADLKNYHIDHIRPCASFDFSDPKEIEKCFHWTHLQPLTPEANLRKGASYLP